MDLATDRSTAAAGRCLCRTVERWKSEEYPAIRAQAEAEGATIYFADEAGIRSDYHAGTTWASVGETPVVKATRARFSVNMVSAVTAKGALRFAVYDEKFTARLFIDFAKRLLHDTHGPVYLIVDGHPTHRAKAVKQFVASTRGRLKLFLLPGYSPELNPDEMGAEEGQARQDPLPRRHQQRRPRPRPSARCVDCRNCHTSSAASSPTSPSGYIAA
jgi:hypothetical protein